VGAGNYCTLCWTLIIENPTAGRPPRLYIMFYDLLATKSKSRQVWNELRVQYRWDQLRIVGSQSLSKSCDIVHPILLARNAQARSGREGVQDIEPRNISGIRGEVIDPGCRTDAEVLLLQTNGGAKIRMCDHSSLWYACAPRGEDYVKCARRLNDW